MRWAAGIVLALGAGVGSAMGGPVWTSFGQWTGGDLEWLVWIMALLFYGIPGLIITGVLATAFLRLGLVGERDAIMTRMALGERRGEIVRAAARGGATTGLAASAVGVPVGMVIAQVTDSGALMSSRNFPDDPSVQWGAIAWSVAVAVGFTAVGAMVHAIAFAAVTRGTPDAMAAASAAGTEVPYSTAEPVRRWHRVARTVPVAAFVFGMAIVILNRAVPLDAWAMEHLSPAGWLMVTKNVGLTLAVVGGTWCGYHLLGWAARRLVRVASAILGRGDATGGRAFAADGLARPTETRRRSLAITGTIMTLWVWAVAASGAEEAELAAALALDADAIVTSVDPWAGTGVPTGLTQFGLDQDVIDALTQDPDLRVIPARILVEDDTSMWFSSNLDPDERELMYQPFSLAITREDADVVAPDAFRQLGLSPGVRLTGRDTEYLRDYEWVEVACCSTGVSTVNTWIGASPVYSLWAQAPMTSVDGAWAREVWGDAPVSALLVFGAGGPDEQFGMPRSSVIAAVEEAVPEGSGFVLTADASTGWMSFTNDGLAMIIGVFGAVVAVVLSAGVASASARSRRRELATFAALGASPRSLRAAPVWEAVVVSVAAVLAGTVLGAALAVTLGNPFVLTPGAPFDLSEIAWHMGRDLAAVPWLGVLGGAALVTTASALVAWLLGRGMAMGTPVDELRTADREGVR